MKVVTVVGNRPQFIKLGATARELRNLGTSAPWSSVVVNTGQHYDQMMADVFFNELEIEAPKYNLELGSGNPIDQIGRMLKPLREILEEERPDGVLVFGDTNSTLGGALAGAHLNIPVIHIEGGERLYRRKHMPEEVNRVATDHLSSLCLVSSAKARRFLEREGFGPQRVKFVGDPMYDLFLFTGKILDSGRRALKPENFGLVRGRFVLATMHRAENTDDRAVCIPLLEALDAAPLPVVLPIHPRLRSRLEVWRWKPSGSLMIVDPMGYFDFQSMLRSCAAVVTDSGGAGREALFSGKTTVVPLESSAWSEAVDLGLAVMTGSCPQRLSEALRFPFNTADIRSKVEEAFGGGDAGQRIVKEVARFLAGEEVAAEEIWHPVAGFRNSQRLCGSAPRCLSALRDLLSHFNSSEMRKPIVLDATKSLRGLEALFELADGVPIDVVMRLSLSEIEWNPMKLESRVVLDRLTSRGLSIFVQGNVPSSGLINGGYRVSVAPWETYQDIAPNQTVRQWIQNLDLTRNAAPIRLEPWQWLEWPTNDFEARLQLVDDAREQSLNAIRDDWFLV
jgi:UDP-GlcNAc3NAcA epimerase